LTVIGRTNRGALLTESPRTALEHVEVLGVIGSALRRRSKPRPDEGQLKMFE
jgi:hypothetical protein